MELDTRDNRTCLWTYERMLAKTEIYCIWHEEYYEQLGVAISGWWMSELALNDVMDMEWPN